MFSVFKMHYPTPSETLQLGVLDNPSHKQLFESQKEAIWSLLYERLAIHVGPCGSGKTTLQLALSIIDVVRSGYVQKQLIVAPENHIGRGFVGDRRSSSTNILLDAGVWAPIRNKCGPHIPDHDTKFTISPLNFCELAPAKKSRLKNWLLATPNQLNYDAGLDEDGGYVGGLVAVTTHQAFTSLWSELSHLERAKAIINCTLRLDEWHHIKGAFDESDDPFRKFLMREEQNGLGSIVTAFAAGGRTSKVCGTTATDFRGDRQLSITPALRDRFAVHVLRWCDYFPTLGIEDVEIRVQEYDGTPHRSLIQNIKNNPNMKRWIIVPRTRQSWRQEYGDYIELFNAIQQINPSFLDLVTEHTQEIHKSILLDEPKTPHQGESQIDIVGGCMLGREGTDWVPCECMDILVVEDSIRLIVQTIMRAFRRWEGKRKVLITFYVPRFRTPNPNLSKRELVSDRVNGSLLALSVSDHLRPELPKMVPIEKKEKKKEERSTPVKRQLLRHEHMAEIFGGEERYRDARKELLTEMAAIKLNEKNKDEVIDNILDRFGVSEENREVVRDSLTFDLLNIACQRCGIELSWDMDVAYIREEGFDKIIEEIGLGNTSLYYGNYDTDSFRIVTKIHKDAEQARTKPKIREIGLLVNNIEDDLLRQMGF